MSANALQQDFQKSLSKGLFILGKGFLLPWPGGGV